ncbi:glycosyltransferase family protein [Pedobacter cryophilus]|uniref:Glycosyltransferase subfamily 4-like N-terminal domain-containing protein n=1 Tax=Pedobacter cryophilus TaxID=2571271 RepID=A0A4U1C5B2_9SPHI|nr:hypothetical protein [Pedobacter cryophilus]TKC00465.1 hypothetical protein FA046_01940 [Pedobacter cryophilus]
MDNNDIKQVILIYPYLREETTSKARFLSILNSLIEEKFDVKILEFKYPLKKRIGLGHDEEKKPLDEFVEDRILKINPRLNFIQKIVFLLINKGYNRTWKLFNFINQILTGKDVFSPSNSNIEELIIALAPIKNGYVIVFGGPFGIFTYADKLSKTINYRLILDYRDPWTFGYCALDANPVIQFLKKKLHISREKNLLDRASLIITVSETLRNYFPKKYQKKIKVIINGSNFEYKQPLKFIEAGTFNIVYLGTIYNEQLKDGTFFEAINIFLKNKNRAKVKVQFLGAHLNKLLFSKINDYKLNDVCEVTNRLKAEELIPYLNDASLFLHLKYGNRSGIITSKQMDYISFRKPILLPKTDNGDLEKSITEHDAGFVCNSIEETLNILEKMWVKFEKNENFNITPNNYSNENKRQSQSKRFVEYILQNE